MFRSAVKFVLPLLLCYTHLPAKDSTPAQKETKSIFAAMEKLKKGEKVLLKGEVFYSEPIRFDYDKDGVKNNVVMASKFFIKQKADSSYDGYIQRFLYDIDKKKPVTWYAKKNMLSEPPVGIDTAVSNVKHEGKTVKFDSGTWHFTMTDGGEGYISDKIIVNDGIRTKQVQMFGGDVEVFTD
ncbi:hypothetical protein AS592_11280 [Sulfurovum riftiae]|uniref:Uncharacterized protein n=1 Tax=Sulfurovum riftiae TaxID=1630136 RepID=A0A151CJJ9_9BACT|nr:hypothetical protein AS592_11280 [Sulfurovum riftiae]